MDRLVAIAVERRYLMVGMFVAVSVGGLIAFKELNIEAYPQSGNVYDSLGEAYMDDGNKPQAIANYQKSLQLNPKNGGAVKMLQKLNAP